MKYWAFLSYSHADKKWGDWLHKALETYRVPRQLVGKESRDGKIPARLFPIFRDREELPVSADLGANINAALGESRYLIVICSPRAAQSRWVGEEIRTFKKLGREDRVLALIVDGEPNAGEGKPGFTEADECFPAPMRYRLAIDGEISGERTEPIAADARANKDGRENAKLKLLAGLLGVNYDDLKQREQRRGVRRRAAAVVFALFVASLVAGVWFVQEAKKRQLASAAQAKEHAQTAQEARSDEARAQELFAAGQWRQGVLHLGRAVRRDDASEVGTAALWQALVYGRGDRDALPEWIAPIKGGKRIVVSPDGARLLVELESEVQVLDVAARKSIGVKIRGRLLPRCDFSSDGKQFVVLAADDRLQLVNSATAAPVGKQIIAEGRITSAALLPDNSAIIVATKTAPVRKWDLLTQNMIGNAIRDPTPQATILLTSDGRTLITSTSAMSLENPLIAESETLRFWKLDEGIPISPAFQFSILANTIPLSADGRRLLVQNPHYKLAVLDVPSGQVVAGPWEDIGPDDCAAVSPDGRFVGVGTEEGKVSVHGVALEGFSAVVPDQSGLIQEIVFTPESRALMIATSDGNAVLWDFVHGLPVSGLLRHRMAVIGVGVTRGNRFIATLEREGAVRIWPGTSFAEDGVTLPLPNVAWWLGATGGYSKFLSINRDGQLELSESETGERSATLGEQDLRSEVQATWSADRRFVFTSSRGRGDGTLWDLRTKPPLGVLIQHGAGVLPQPNPAEGRAAPVLPLSCSIFSPDGKVLATGGGDGRVKFWSVPSGLPALPSLEFPVPVTLMSWGSAIENLAIATGWHWWKESGRSDQVHLWDLEANQRRGQIIEPGPSVDRIAFSPTGTLMATIQNGSIRLWDSGSGQPREGPAGEHAPSAVFAFSPDGTRYVAGGRDGSEAFLWNSATGQQVGSPMRTEHYFSAVAWSPDGRWLATGTWDEGGGPFVGHVQIWDGATARPVGTAWKFTHSIGTVEWSADGRTLTAVENGAAIHRFRWCPPSSTGAWLDDLVLAETGLSFSTHQSAQDVPMEERVAARSRVVASLRADQTTITECGWSRFLETWVMSAGRRAAKPLRAFVPWPTPAAQLINAKPGAPDASKSSPAAMAGAARQDASLNPSPDKPWLIADSSKRRLTSEELRTFTAEQLWQARNEIFARHGLIFSTERGKAFSRSLGSRYRGTDADQGRVFAALNEIERANVELLKALEDRKTH